MNAILVERTQRLSPVLSYALEVSDTESELGMNRAPPPPPQPQPSLRGATAASQPVPDQCVVPSDHDTRQQASAVATTLTAEVEGQPEADQYVTEQSRIEAATVDDDNDDGIPDVLTLNDLAPVGHDLAPVRQQQRETATQGSAHSRQGHEVDAPECITWLDPGHNLETVSEASETSTADLMYDLDEALSSSHEYSANVSAASRTSGRAAAPPAQRTCSQQQSRAQRLAASSAPDLLAAVTTATVQRLDNDTSEVASSHDDTTEADDMPCDDTEADEISCDEEAEDDVLSRDDNSLTDAVSHNQRCTDVDSLSIRITGLNQPTDDDDHVEATDVDDALELMRRQSAGNSNNEHDTPRAISVATPRSADQVSSASQLAGNVSPT